jgi:orotate phosphoribosyltransferase/AMMECR1 domain-containing protein
MFYSWGTTLTPDGLRLAACCILDRLKTYESTQLAGHGMTALPLVSACVTLGKGRYTGVAIRKERKTYLSGRRVEGRPDPNRPVVVIDDSLSSGTALRDAIGALEAEGLSVEGAIALVGFPGRGGIEWATANGYRVEVLLDITTDLGMELHSSPEPMPPLPRTHSSPPFPNGLAPATLARLTAGHVLRQGTSPTAPAELDRAYDGRGGVFVSFRRRSDDHRVARDGAWHFDADAFDAPADVVAATIRTLRTSRGAVHLGNLASLKVAVTFLGPLEPIAPRQLDFDRYAIVVRDMQGVRAGGALPNTQVFTSEVEQYRHARERNARIGPTEPHVLMRQEVEKAVESGERWPAYGVPDGPELAWTTDATFGAAVTNYARSLLPGEPQAPAPTDELLPSSFEAIAVTLYHRGTLGAGIAWGHSNIADLIKDAALRALRSAERTPGREVEPRRITVSVTVLHEAEQLGVAPLSFVATKVRRGLDALRADSAQHSATLLPGALVYNGWSKQHLVQEAAKRTQAPVGAAFTTYRTASWANDALGLRQLRSGFPVRSGDDDDDSHEDNIRSLVAYTLRNNSSAGIPLYYLNPVTGRRSPVGTGPRQLHALYSLDRAGLLLDKPSWRTAASRGLDRYLGDHDPRPGGFAARTGGPLADAIALRALNAPDSRFAQHPGVRPIAERLIRMVHENGLIAASAVRLDVVQDLEFLPGAVLAALASQPELLERIPTPWWPKMLRRQRHRFHVLRGWGHVGWQMQGWAAVYRHQREDEQATFVFELADWAIDRQLEVKGAFLEELSPEEPSFNTGFLGEGIAAAWATALMAGDADRATRYERAWQAANRFMRTLLIRPDDTFCFRSPEAAVGGVRLTPSRADIRSDSVSHWLNALVSGAEVLEHPTQTATSATGSLREV